jgi:gliding motility-associated-like protein
MDGSIDLTPSGGTPSYSYAWSNGSTTEDLSGLGFGTYSVTITDANGCPEDIASFTLNDQPRITVDLLGNNITCFGFTDGSVDLTVLSGGAAPYTFAWSELSVTEDIADLSAGSYSVSVTDINNCPETIESISLSEPDEITTTLTSACLNGLGYIYSSTAGGTSPYSYTWSNGSTSPDLSNLDPGLFLLTVTDANGCPPAEEEIEFVPCTIIIPNAFTPNDNGQNDVWDLQKLAYYPDCRVKVYNRWGDVVFSSQGYDNPWDGKHRLTSVDLPSAVYYYVIENVSTEFVEEGSFLHGYVTIVR